ncbi:MAG: L-seryl-tRNA(Sec) selenium transferase [Coriobacteriales bacterium]|nr:L-seryl-tRNA(Sec) selenium transferase [Coriobacteriales bacterium]
MDTNSLLRALPNTDDVLAQPGIVDALGQTPRSVVVTAVRESIEDARRRIFAGEELSYGVEAAAADALARVAIAESPSLHRVINATGIIVHTNLGRSVLSAAAIDAVAEVARGYSTLEYDVESGERGSRHVHVESLLTELTGAEAAMAVNNNAAAVMMALAVLAHGKEAIVSRGQLVEIGGSFRVPDIMRESGATMIEVGTTNKTHLSDYEAAIGPNTGLILKVHSSNFRVVGFTEEVPVRDLVELAARHAVPVYEDQGSGVLFDLRRYGLPYEPTVRESIQQGADLVSFSGDKLLGGPQAGMIVGRWDIVQRLKKHPLARAMRLDKMTLAALETTLRTMRDEARAVEEIPTLKMLTTPAAEIGARAHELAGRIEESTDGAAVIEVVEDISRAGGGALPLADIPTFVVTIEPRAISDVDLESRMRLGEPTIVARLREGRLVIDPRTLLDAEEENVVVTRLGEILRGA